MNSMINGNTNGGGSLVATLLWTNANPSQEILSPLTIDLDLKSYKKLLVVGKRTTTDSLINFQSEVYKNTKGAIISDDWGREFEFNNEHFIIGLSSNNSYIIPIYVYGLK